MDACRVAVTETHPLSSRVWVSRNCDQGDAEAVTGPALQGSSEPSSRLSIEKSPGRVGEHPPHKECLTQEYHMKPRVPHESMTKTQRQTPGDGLRSLRQQRGLTLRDVHKFSLDLARTSQQPGCVIPPSRLHEFETKNIVPSIHRLCTLARVYSCSLQRILKLYGLPPR